MAATIKVLTRETLIPGPGNHVQGLGGYGHVEVYRLLLKQSVDYWLRRRLIAFLFSRDKRWAAHQPLYIDQYECLTASPSVARHHVLALTLLRSASGCSASLPCSLGSVLSLVRRGPLDLRSSFPDFLIP